MEWGWVGPLSAWIFRFLRLLYPGEQGCEVDSCPEVKRCPMGTGPSPPVPDPATCQMAQ